jgi:mRNA interferase HicA|nr:MAG: toxin [Bacteriophage sp.]UVY68833.1 MAG: toxin [Bacteriophage sp.]
MKQRELTQRLENGGFVFERHGAGHDIYVRGTQRETVPRHKEINEQLARAILRRNGLL